ncbi:NAD(P)H-hydrate dehydratase [Papillibacter cinnamivorans]|uniref:Bifunctional NAD(P)H-hydrate repair enzyme n=1 Tax=Papillibacter cinnamivorans DSM 12816 TaxID=1122930 RepID=A0A1W1ZB13_9FIRM|nr:NAD(P)H-hydrate dehydratase [Papillibacter cinnamivorans]SMC45607.1 NAD(P)H-hydrate epimerase [Papillibacter cinnamivorans DSM 12816]
MKLATARQMKELDGYAIHTLGISSLLLMENAAAALAEEAAGCLMNPGERIAVFCGGGNNGGDGAAAARILARNGAEVRLFLTGDREKFTPDLKEMLARYETAGGEPEEFIPGDPECEAWCAGASVLIDALFGIGLNSPLRGRPLAAVELMNRLKVPVVAADIASGVESDTGQILGAAPKCVKTITFTYPKIGHFCGEGGLLCGDLRVAGIGIPEEALSRIPDKIFAVDDEDTRELLPRRRRDSHKGDYGRVLLVCGSRDYTGAPAFSARAAVRTGSGLVFLGVPASIHGIEAEKNDEAMVISLPEEEGKLSPGAVPVILEQLRGCDACLIGPGLGRSEGVSAAVRAVLETCRVPLVIDADGINALAGNIDIWKRNCPVILTPHEGEFQRLLGRPMKADRISQAREFAQASGCILILKGYRTVTALPDGRVYINTTGNPGMAKGGSGDVLSGMLVSLLGQGLSPERAAWGAVWLHGRAGDTTASEKGEYGMTPTDMIEAIPKATMQY